MWRHIACAPLVSCLLLLIVAWLDCLLCDQTRTFCISAITMLWSDNGMVNSIKVATIIVFWFPTSVADVLFVLVSGRVMYVSMTLTARTGIQIWRLGPKQIMTVIKHICNIKNVLRRRSSNYGQMLNIYERPSRMNPAPHMFCVIMRQTITI